jgi:hypothetical protein
MTKTTSFVCDECARLRDTECPGYVYYVLEVKPSFAGLFDRCVVELGPRFYRYSGEVGMWFSG